MANRQTLKLSVSPASAVAITCAAVAGAPAAPAVQSPPETIKVTGTVRDFAQSHPDFAITPAGGYGHYAGNLATSLGPDLRPVFASGGGFKVGDQWTNMHSDPIPPHLFAAAGGPPINVVNAPDIQDTSYMDTWDSSLGDYGGSNVGPAPAVNVGAPMPSVAAPVGLPFTNEYKREGSGTWIISSDFECNRFKLEDDAKVTIVGARTIVVNGEFQLLNFCEIQLSPGSSLNLYLMDGGWIENHSLVNTSTHDPSLVNIYSLGTTRLMMENNVDVYARIISPDAKLQIENDSEFFGGFTGELLHMENNGAYHHDGPSGKTVCGTLLEDEAGTSAMASSGGVTSAATFDQWYHDTLGVNASAPHTITLTRNGSGVYEMLENAFFPIDNQLLGNEGAAHNFNFTLTFGADFEYTECAGLFFEFEGADDAWMFIGDELALDLGGVMPGTRQYVEIDRLDLTDGETYKLRFFYAQRNGSQAVFRLRTNLPLVGDPPPYVVSGGFD